MAETRELSGYADSRSQSRDFHGGKIADAYTDFPLTHETPQIIYDYMQKYGYYPAELAVNPVHKPPFPLDEYQVRGPNPNPSAPLSPNGDIPLHDPVYYIVAIKYDDAVGLDMMVCQRKAEREQ